MKKRSVSQASSSKPAAAPGVQAGREAKQLKRQEEEESSQSSSNDDDEDEENDSSDEEDEENDSSDDDDLRDDFEENDDEDDEGMEEEHLNVVGSSKFSSALKKLLVVGGDARDDASVDGEEIITEPQALFQKKTKIQRLAEQEKREAQEKKKKMQARAEFDLRNLDTLQGAVDPSKVNRERELKRTATRGVVALFNAIGAHQRVITTTADPVVQAQSKENFLKMLKDKALGNAASSNNNKKEEEQDAAASDEEEEEDAREAKPSSWKVLQEDYLEQVAEDSEDDEEAEPSTAIREEEEN